MGAGSHPSVPLHMLVGEDRRRAVATARRRPGLGGRRRRRRTVGEVAIIGAGPNGLSAAAYLRDAGVPVAVFGKVLQFWLDAMPEGMILRSRLRSSHIADPVRSLTVEHFEADRGRTVSRPSLRLDEFVDYARWYQQRAVPDVDPRMVRRLERTADGFGLTLSDGSQREARRVVVAAGLAPFAHRPAPFASLPAALVSHSSEHPDLGGFAGSRVMVVGCGQSALESAALLHERGARVEVVARAEEVHWLPDDGAPPVRRGLRSRLPRPPTDVGGFADGWAAAVPDLFRSLPDSFKPTVSYRCIRPAGSGWLRDRLSEVPIELDAAPVAAEALDGGVRVHLADGSERDADHVLLGTGYDVDVRRYPFLGRELAQEIDVEAGYPVLMPGLESSVPGLHFTGAAAASSFGPVMRFVVGTWYAAPAIRRRVLGRHQLPLSFAF